MPSSFQCSVNSFSITSDTQDALVALDQEIKAREDALAALEYQTVGKEEALASLEVERKAREELTRSKEEVLASLSEERKALEAESRARLDAIAALEEEMSSKEEAQSALEEQRRENIRLGAERDRRQAEDEALRQEVRELTAKLEATESQVSLWSN